MPRKLTRKRRLSLSQPLTFSQFARSVARMASAPTDRRQSDDQKPDLKSTRYSKGKECSKHSLEKTNEESESSEGEFDGIVQADFSFFDPKPDDFHGVKILLQSYLDNKEWDLTGFVDLILGQTTVGTVVKIEDDEDNGLFAVISALNLGRYKDHKCIKELKELLMQVCPKNITSDLQSLLGERSHNVGLLVSQRVVNLPPQLFPPLYDALFDEISWATEDEPTEELRNSFRFTFYLLISKVYKPKNSNHKKISSADADEETLYVKPEDEIFHKMSTWSFLFPLHNQPVAPHELRNYQLMGLVMAVEAEQIPEFRKQLHSLVNES